MHVFALPNWPQRNPLRRRRKERSMAGTGLRCVALQCMSLLAAAGGRGHGQLINCVLAVPMSIKACWRIDADHSQRLITTSAVQGSPGAPPAGHDLFFFCIFFLAARIS
jgi:hypothetical protein